MDTEAVRLFVMAADMLNISRAGKKLGLSPAVASARLAKLEVSLGRDLLHRSTRRVTLSEDGAAFLPYAREMLAQEDSAFSALGHGATDIRGTIRFAASSSFAQRFIAPILPDFLAEYPHILMDLRFSDSQFDLIEGGFDLALRNDAIPDSSLMGRKLAEDTRILCAAPHYLAARGPVRTPNDLLDHHTLSFRNARPRALRSPRHAQGHTFPPLDTSSTILCDDGASMRLLAVAGAGICMSSLWNVYEELENGSLVRVLGDYEVDDDAAIWLVYPKSNVLTAKTRVFIDFLVDRLAPLPHWRG